MVVVVVAVPEMMSELERQRLCAGDPICLYCYYGGAYTLPAFRGRGIQTAAGVPARRHEPAAA